MRRKPKRGTKPALRMAARRSRIRLASAQMALISLIFVTPMATSSSGLPGKLAKETNWIADEIPLTRLRVRLGYASPTLHNPLPQWGGEEGGGGSEPIIRPTPNGPSCTRHANA